MSRTRRLEGYVLLEGEIECLSGLHIGSGREGSEIGGIDQPVVRHPVTREPYVPGSSLRGRLRSLREKALGLPSNRSARGDGGDVWRHECERYEQARACPLCRVFGAAGRGGLGFPGALIVRDGALTEATRGFLLKDGVLTTEAKSENSLDRLTAAATPRLIERVPAGAAFGLSLVIRAESHGDQGDRDFDPAVFAEDIRGLLATLAHLELEGLGAHASRGYGRVAFAFKSVRLAGADAAIRELWAADAAEKGGKGPAELLAAGIIEPAGFAGFGAGVDTVQAAGGTAGS